MTGCSNSSSPKHVINYTVDTKFCISVCRNYEFKNFHSGISSNTELSQEKIYDKITNECKEFYINTSCCKWNNDYTRNSNISHIHGYEYGECK